jgi:chromosome segregation ATPase
MARPLSSTASYRGATNGNQQSRYRLDDQPGADADNDSAQEIDLLRAENIQLRSLCAELEKALGEASQQHPDQGSHEDRIREYEVLMEEKTETIRLLHEQLQEARALLEENQPVQPANAEQPVPCEDELLKLSEELERERRQLQDDEQSVMEQMRQMEMTMARERAEMARQRNDLQRLYSEIRHEMERLERNGALQNKMDELKAKLQDVQNRRGAAPATASRPTGTPQAGAPSAPTPTAPPKKDGFMGRLFGK